MNTPQMLAEGILSCKQALGRYLVGFDDSNHTHQAVNLPNHVAWTLGHCALTMHRAAEKIDGRAMPETDFIAGAAACDATRYGTESVAFNSLPVGDAEVYPRFARCVAIYEGACERLAAAVRGADAAVLEKTVKWGQGELPMGMLAMRIIFHNGTHCGQIADLRRALEFRSIFV
jgi:hypothetical protein